MTKSILGLCALAAGIVALGLAVIPAIVYDMPPPWRCDQPARVEPKIEGQKAVEWRGLKFKWGGKPVKDDPPAAAAAWEPQKAFALATALVALLGLALSPLAFWRERQYSLAVPGLALSGLALTWQYVVFGITVGVAAAVFLIVLAALSGGAN